MREINLDDFVRMLEAVDKLDFEEEKRFAAYSCEVPIRGNIFQKGYYSLKIQRRYTPLPSGIIEEYFAQIVFSCNGFTATKETIGGITGDEAKRLYELAGKKMFDMRYSIKAAIPESPHADIIRRIIRPKEKMPLSRRLGR